MYRPNALAAVREPSWKSFSPKTSYLDGQNRKRNNVERMEKEKEKPPDVGRQG